MEHREYIRDVCGADTAVLFIHGFLGSPVHFEKFIKCIPETVTVHNILLEGHGGSVRDFAGASMEKWKAQAGAEASALCERYDNVIIVAHSMGTFFAMDAALKYPDKVKCIMLLQSPLKIGVKARATINTFKSLFNIFGGDETAMAYKNSHSVRLNMRVWEYVGWLPRYMELFAESLRSRETVKLLNTPTYIFQGKKDELVSMKSVKFIPECENIYLTVLENSAHFIYDKNDFELMLSCFKKLMGE